jgi:hypothetical protein
MIKATVSGSFHRHIQAIYIAVNELRAAGVNVLSPSDPRIVDHLGEFLFVASDKLRSVKLVQDRHFEAIRASNFLWLVTPDGYVGPSSSAEIGAAVMSRTPIYSTDRPLDLTLQQYVKVVPSARFAIEDIRDIGVHSTRIQHVYIDPEQSLAKAIDGLEKLQPVLLGKTRSSPERSRALVEQQLALLSDIVGSSSRDERYRENT